MNLRRWNDIQNRGYKQPINMTRKISKSWLLAFAAAAALSDADAFTHHPSVMRHSSSMHQKCNHLHLSTLDEEIPLDVVSASDIPTVDNAKDMLKQEMSEVGPDGVMPFAPMMTFNKFLTMQVCL